MGEQSYSLSEDEDFTYSFEIGIDDFKAYVQLGEKQRKYL